MAVAVVVGVVVAVVVLQVLAAQVQQAVMVRRSFLMYWCHS